MARGQEGRRDDARGQADAAHAACAWRGDQSAGQGMGRVGVVRVMIYMFMGWNGIFLTSSSLIAPGCPCSFLSLSLLPIYLYFCVLFSHSLPSAGGRVHDEDHRRHAQRSARQDHQEHEGTRAARGGIRHVWLAGSDCGPPNQIAGKCIFFFQTSI